MTDIEATKTEEQHDDRDRLLTAEDILKGGDDPYIRLEVDALRKSGRPGVVYLKALSARTFIDFSKVDNDGQTEAMIPLIAKSIVTKDGTPVFTEEQAKNLAEIRGDAFMELQMAITKLLHAPMEDAGGSEGNA